MGTPKARARWLRGALVGGTSAVLTAGAHSAAGGGIPGGGALVIALLACATVGAVLGGLRLQGRGARWMATTCGLCVAQLLGHAALMTAGHHHGGGILDMDASMAAAHLGAAVILGLAITAAEYLYVVCSSVLCWLRLFAMRALQPVARPLRRTSKIVVVAPVLVTGLGMRAPPWVVAAA
ncbi:hypothetical protein [Mycolicibacterium hippocampi]|uniref:hypothetical protein n=1 Tax=Mycolicibacterium hippocampi TaxID=659824 RepID=UPI003512A1D2